LKTNFPAYSEVRSQLCRHRAKRCLDVPDPLCIPDPLRVTLRAREAADDSPHKTEQFLLYSGQGGKLQIFCAPTELAAIHQTEYLVANGTFEMAPDSAYQVYTMHGYVRGEGMSLLWALLPNKTTATYVELFSVLRSSLTTKFGNIGKVRYVLTDFERAAISAINEIFPEAVTKGCSFHYQQAIMRRIQHEGLKAAYDSPEAYPQLRTWMRSLMALSMLPSFAIPIIWS